MITLERGEKILMEVRRHPIVIVVQGFAVVLLAILTLLIVLFLVQYFFSTSINGIGSDQLGNMYLFIVTGWFWFVWMMFFVMWTNYYLDVVVITNKRLIDMEQFVLFSRDEVTTPLTNIEDIKIEVLGLIPTLLRFGNLQVQTAGASRETIATKIRRPHQVRACLEGAVEKCRKKS